MALQRLCLVYQGFAHLSRSYLFDYAHVGTAQNLHRLTNGLSLFWGHTIYGATNPNDFGLRSLMETYLVSGNLIKLYIQYVNELFIDLIVFSPTLKILEIKSCELMPVRSSQLVPACRLTDLTLYDVKKYQHLPF